MIKTDIEETIIHVIVENGLKKVELYSALLSMLKMRANPRSLKLKKYLFI